MKVRNINDTSDTKCKCGSWLDHWSKFGGGSLPTFCSEVKCTNKDLVGAHVQNDIPTDSKWYIVPLCNSHNQKGGEIEIVASVKLVPANKKETCEKN